PASNTASRLRQAGAPRYSPMPGAPLTIAMSPGIRALASARAGCRRSARSASIWRCRSMKIRAGFAFTFLSAHRYETPSADNCGRQYGDGGAGGLRSRGGAAEQRARHPQIAAYCAELAAATADRGRARKLAARTAHRAPDMAYGRHRGARRRYRFAAAVGKSDARGDSSVAAACIDAAYRQLWRRR